MKETEDSAYQLTGEANYLGWIRVANARLAEKGCFTASVDKEGKAQKTLSSEKDDLACGVLHRIISMKILQSIPAKVTSATGILAWLEVEFGSVDWYTRKQQWKQVKMAGLDPMPYFDAYNIAYANYLAADGPDSPTDALDILMEGLNQKFYRDCIRSIRAARRKKGEVDVDFVSRARKEIKEYYADTPKADEKEYSAATATDRPGRTPRHCTICATAKRHARVVGSHDTAHHREISPRTNKGDTEYSHLTADTGLDTGANDHFFCDHPSDNYEPKTGTVTTADGGQAPIIGIGSIQLGKLRLNNVLHVPTFKRNLVSGARLLDDGFTLVARKNTFRLS